MDLKNIFSIAGKPGLYQLITQSKSGVLVKNLEDGKKIHADASSRISGLGDISIYTDTEEVALSNVFEKALAHFDNQECTINLNKDTDQMVEAFEAILPDYDRDRVYNSDIKKVFKWYNTLLTTGHISASKQEATTSNETAE